MFTIGEFSRLCGLSVITLRFYHEQGLLEPSVVDSQTGYRRYSELQVETARVIAELRKLEFPLAGIHELLTRNSDDDLLRHIERQREVLARKVKAYRQTIKSLDRFIDEERRAKAMAASAFEVEEKILQPLLIASIRIKGCYSDCGKGFAQLGRSLGRHICGKPLLLHYDDEHKEDDADFAACMPVRPAKAARGIAVQELPGGRCISLVNNSNSGGCERLSENTQTDTANGINHARNANAASYSSRFIVSSLVRWVPLYQELDFGQVICRVAPEKHARTFQIDFACRHDDRVALRFRIPEDLRVRMAEVLVWARVRIGLNWMVANWALDALMFSSGPMKMSVHQYVNEIAGAYLMIPVITVGLGIAATRARRAPPQP